jgi:hypothetical protein
MAAEDTPRVQLSDREIVDDALRLITDLDNTRPDEMTALFYMHGFNELNTAVRDLLRIMGEVVGE